MPCQAIKVGKGRISLIDIGSEITSEPVIAQKDFINVYLLSAEIDRNKKTVLAIQGLEDQGETSFFINTQNGARNIEVVLDNDSSELKSIDPRYKRTKILERTINLNNNSSLIVTSPYYINDYILASDPNLFSLDPFSKYYDENYLKNFILSSKEHKAKTEIIVPTTKQIFKFTIDINNNKRSYDNEVNLI
jgi:hypothetical protein